jgi:hypothetical protein
MCEEWKRPKQRCYVWNAAKSAVYDWKDRLALILLSQVEMVLLIDGLGGGERVPKLQG